MIIQEPLSSISAPTKDHDDKLNLQKFHMRRLSKKGFGVGPSLRDKLNQGGAKTSPSLRFGAYKLQNSFQTPTPMVYIEDIQTSKSFVDQMKKKKRTVTEFPDIFSPQNSIKSSIRKQDISMMHNEIEYELIQRKPTYPRNYSHVQKPVIAKSLNYSKLNQRMFKKQKSVAFEAEVETQPGSINTDSSSQDQQVQPKVPADLMNFNSVRQGIKYILRADQKKDSLKKENDPLMGMDGINFSFGKAQAVQKGYLPPISTFNEQQIQPKTRNQIITTNIHHFKKKGRSNSISVMTEGNKINFIDQKNFKKPQIEIKKENFSIKIQQTNLKTEP